ncbi:MAG: DUF4266 domain-containing protein [Flavobacteriales bacterium]|nr:DUF4266 domain-containing protein [Flavobacteriales bacterium]
MRTTIILSALLLLATLSGCVQVKAYQKAYLNDEDMDLGTRSIDAQEVAFQSYREGASGANGGKVGGGCGCN